MEEGTVFIRNDRLDIIIGTGIEDSGIYKTLRTYNCRGARVKTPMYSKGYLCHVMFVQQDNARYLGYDSILVTVNGLQKSYPILNNNAESIIDTLDKVQRDFSITDTLTKDQTMVGNIYMVKGKLEYIFEDRPEYTSIRFDGVRDAYSLAELNELTPLCEVEGVPCVYTVTTSRTNTVFTFTTEFGITVTHTATYDVGRKGSNYLALNAALDDIKAKIAQGTATEDAPKKDQDGIVMKEENSVERADIENIGAASIPKQVLLSTPKIDLKVDKRETLESQFTSIVSTVSDLTTEVNKHSMLKDAEDLREAFTQTKERLSVHAVAEPTRLKGYLDSMLGNNKLYKKLADKASKVLEDNASTQSEIDYLFGLTHTKFEKLVTTGEAMQEYKAQLEAQIKELARILRLSQAALAKYDEGNKPIRMVATNTHIVTALEKYKTRLLQISGSIIIAQNTIEDLGSKLPAHKADLTDDMALNNMLSSIDGLHQMCQEIASLSMTVTATTQEKMYNTINDMMTAQIKDTTAVEAIEAATAQGEKMATMLVENTKKMATKVLREAAQIEELAGGVLIEHAQKSIKELQ